MLNKVKEILEIVKKNEDLINDIEQGKVEINFKNESLIVVLKEYKKNHIVIKNRIK